MTINLDLDPYERWKAPTEHFKTQILILHNTIMGYVPWFIEGLFWIAAKIMEYRTQSLTNYGELSNGLFREIQGMADILEVPVHQVMVSNFIYELFAHCTSVISIDHNGEIIHARNMDYPIFDSMRDDTYEADFYRNGELVFKATTNGGGFNTYTIMKPGKFAVSINARHEDSITGVAKSLIRYFSNAHNPGTLLRYVGENANSFEEAKEMLMNLQITSPCYYTLSGIEPHEGVIITRSRSETLDLWPINPDSKVDWTIYQTNYDHWISPAPKVDNNRAASAKASLEKIGSKDMNIKKLVKKVLQIPPVYQESTIFSVAMSAKRNLYKTYRYI